MRAAWELAERDGIGALTLSDLAGQLDMAPQSLYGYFGSKHDVYDAMFREANEALRTHVSRAADEHPTGRSTGAAAIGAFVDHYLDFCLASPARFQLLFQRPVPGFEPSAESMQVAAEVLTWAIGVLGEAGIDDVQLVLIALGAVSGIVNYQIANRLPDDVIRQLAHRAIGIFLAGIEAEAGE